LFAECIVIAQKIFEEYLTFDSGFAIILDDSVRCNIYKKFGCPLRDEMQDIYTEEITDESLSKKLKNVNVSKSGPGYELMNDPSSYDHTKTDEKVLIHNLNLSLFNEIFTTALGSLDAAFEQFKKSLNYAILKEDIKR